MEQTARDGKNLIGQGSEARREDDPEVILIIQFAHTYKTLHREDVRKEPLRQSGIFACRGMPAVEAYGIADHCAHDRARQTDQSVAERT